MSRLLIVLLTPLVLALALACKGDGGPDVTASPTAEGSATATPVADGSPTASPTADKTPTAEATPPDGSPIANAGATPVAVPPNINEYLDRIGDRTVVRELCDSFDPATGLADCGERGVFKPDPPPPDDAVCGVLLADGELIGVSCTSAEQANVNIYLTSP